MDKHRTYISVRYENGSIRVFRKAIRLLGRPKYIRFCLNSDKTLLAVEPYNKKTLTSFEVPENLHKENGSMCVYSKMLCASLYKIMGWDEYELYRVPGIVLCHDNVAVFELKKAKIYNDEEF